jgi:hypothetical protein
MEDELRVRIYKYLITVAIAVTGTSALFMTKCSHTENEDKIEEDGTYTEQRDSLVNVIDSLSSTRDTLIILKNKVKIKKEIEFIDKIHLDTIEVLKRDSTLVIEIYKRDTIISLANDIIENQRQEISTYSNLDMLNHKRISSLELKILADTRTHRQEADSLSRKIRANRIKYIGYGFVLGVGVRSLLP